MSEIHATTRVAVKRGGTENALGDVVDGAVTVAGLGDLPMAITEKSRKVFPPESDEARTVRYVVGRAVGTADIRQGDRILDNRTGRTYAVSEVTGGERTIAGTRPLLLDLRKL